MLSLNSELTKQLLGYLFLHPQDNFYTNELSRKLKLDKRNLVKKLKQLEEEGLLLVETRGNLKLYSLNRGYPLYNEYRGIIAKTAGLGRRLKKVVKGLPGLKKIYIYGSYVQGRISSHSDIDLLCIGKHSILLLQRRLNKLQREIDREINTVNMDEGEFSRRVKNKDPFILGILEKKHFEMNP